MAKKEKSSREKVNRFQKKEIIAEVPSAVVYEKPLDKKLPPSTSAYSRAPTPKEKHFRKTFNREFRDTIDLGDIIQISDDEFGKYQGFARGRTPGDSNVIYINYIPAKVDLQTAPYFPESTNIDGKDYVIKYRKV